MARIVFINPVGGDDFDQPVNDFLQEYKREDTELEVCSLPRGPFHLEYHYYEALIGPDLLKIIREYDEKGFDAAVIGCFYDPFLREAREIVTGMNVTAPAEASMMLASSLANRFSIIVGRDKWIPKMEENVYHYGYQKQLASFRSVGLGVLEFHENEELTEKRLMEEAKKARDEDQAEAIILGCTIQFGFFKKLQQILEIPVIDVVQASFKYAELLADLNNQLGWKHSKNIGYEAPPSEEIKSWRLDDIYN